MISMEDWKTTVFAFVGGSLMPWIINLFKAKNEAEHSQFDIDRKSVV